MALGRSGWTIARIDGIPIRVHPTFLLLIAFVALGWFGPPLTGALWLAVLFASVVVHELAHSIVARRHGLRVIDIVLLPLGGASEIDDLGADPRAEIVVAAAGPVTSTALGSVLLAVAAVVHGTVAPALAGGPLLVRLGWVNLLLAAFNLLPALPMDGGRILRAALATRLGSVEATVRAATVSRWLALVMGAIGVMAMPWLLVIAVFVWFSGGTEAAAVVLHDELAPLHVRDVMVPLVGATEPPSPLAIPADTPLEDALRTMLDRSAKVATAVDDDEHVVGVLVLDLVAEHLQSHRHR